MNPQSESPGPLFSRLPRLAVFLWILPSLAACGSGGPEGVRTQIRDSVGIAIAESTALPGLGAGGWVLEREPELSIGTFQGDTLYQLYQISGGARLPDGRFVLSDNGSFQLRIFGSDGAFQRSWGREGEGPGEFQSVEIVGVLGQDTLVVMDGRLRRISLFHPEKGFLAQNTVDERAGHMVFTNGMFRDGSIVLGGGITFGPGGDTPVNGVNRSDTPYRSARLDGTFGAALASVPGPEMFMQAQGGGGEFHISAMSIPFARSPAAHARGDRFYVGSADTYEVLAFEPGGRLARIIRILQPPVPVTAGALERLVEERVAELEDPALAPGLRSTLQSMPTPETMPAFQSFTVDSEGFLWVEDFQEPGDRLRSWTVFDREGSPRTRLSLPSENRVLEIGEDYLMAVFVDPLGVEYLRLYTLHRGS